ncbi:MAG: hypothetical protein K9I34_00350 [Bacteroidales bacterium]|nr:hypothetical protein [Bacteroidales bacterium]
MKSQANHTRKQTEDILSLLDNPQHYQFTGDLYDSIEEKLHTNHKPTLFQSRSLVISLFILLMTVNSFVMIISFNQANENKRQNELTTLASEYFDVEDDYVATLE